MRTLFILLLLCVPARGDILRDVAESACRVTAGNGVGSGAAVFMDDSNIYVLTNQHVVENYRQAQVEFWKYGRKVPKPITGNVIWRRVNYNYNLDFAIIALPKNSIASPPKIISFVPKDYVPEIGTYVVTAGCPRAQWLSIKEGSVTSINGSEIKFRPVAEDGQSGSGLFVKVNGEARILGIVTARTEPQIYRDNNGFDVPLGVAYSVNGIRTRTNMLTQKNNLLHLVSEQLYAIDVNGKYWKMNADGSVNVPAGTQIQKWRVPGRGQRVPQPSLPPQTQPQNGYGQVPPGFGESSLAPIVDPEEQGPSEIPDNSLQKEIDELKQHIEGYQKTIEDKEKELEVLKKELEDCKKSGLLKNKQIEEAQLQIVQLEESLQNLQTQNITLNNDIELKNKKIEELNVQFSEMETVINNLLIQIENDADTDTISDTDTKSDTNLPQPFWTPLINKAFSAGPWWWVLLGGGLTFLGNKAYKWYKNKPQNRQEYNTQDDDLRSVLKKYFAKVDAMQDYNSEKWNEIENKVNSNVVNNNINIDNDEGLDIEGLKNKPADEDSLERIKQLFELKSRDGEKIEQWAFYATLYKEAMTLLRRGEFGLNVVGKSITLQGQRIAADKIDEWVRNEYIRRTTVQSLQLNTIYHEAMLGFLYKEAVSLLRQGRFSVLGAKETADVIESWVKREFLKRMGITL